MAQKVRRTSPREKSRRLADPGTYAVLDAVMAEAKAKFGARQEALVAEIKALQGEQGSSVKLMALKAEFSALSLEEKSWAETEAARRLSPDEGRDMAPDAPLHPRPPVYA